MVEHGERLTIELRPAISEVIEESVRLAATLPETVIDDRSAIAHGPQAANTWARLRALHTTWATTHALLDELRTNSALACADSGWPVLLDPLEHRFRDPEPLSSARVYRAPAPLYLATVAQLGAGPGVYTADEVTGLRAQRAVEVPAA